MVARNGQPGEDASAVLRPGLFGKLPARGDFVSRGVPRTVMRPLESWLEQVMSGSRAHLGAQWDSTYMVAPIWRFWFGPDLMGGATVTGAMTPSVDRVGRRFPLLVLLAVPRGTGHVCPPPVLSSPDRNWDIACDRFLHMALDQPDMEAVEAGLAALAPPALEADELSAAEGHALWAQAGPEGLDGLWSALRRRDHALACSGRSYWWTAGYAGAASSEETEEAGQDEHTPPEAGWGASVIALQGLPDAATFAFMLTGATGAEETPEDVTLEDVVPGKEQTAHE